MSLLEISHLTTKFETQQGTVSAVRDVSYHLEEGEVLGIVGESGSGKIVGMIFQDPMTFLNPILKIGIQMTEGIRKHQNCSKKEAEAKAIELMRQVGIPSPEKRLDQYPFEFSGGMRRRIIIATALACDPKLIIADEPTTALDVTVQAQILELLKKLTKEKGTSVIMITHDLGVVASMCDRIAIMYAGQIVEEGTVDEIFYEPHHPYTKGLLNSINNSAKDNDEPLVPIPGTPPDDDDKIRLNQRKPSKYKGLSRFGPEKNLQRINKFMKERPIFYKNLIQMKENFRFYLRCFYCITKVVILQFNSENRTELARNG